MARSEKSVRWQWLALALVPVLLVALVVGGLRPTSAQDDEDATPSGAEAATPFVGAESGRPANIRTGTCEAGGVGAIVQSLSNVTATEGDGEGQDLAVTAETSFTTVALTLDDLLDVDHVVNVHLSGDEFETYIACGEIGGVINDNGNLVIGLKEVNDLGWTGVAFLAPGVDGTSTEVSVFIAQGLDESTDTSAAASPISVQATEAAGDGEATEEAGDGEATEEAEATEESGDEGDDEDAEATEESGDEGDDEDAEATEESGDEGDDEEAEATEESDDEGDDLIGDGNDDDDEEPTPEA